MAFILIGQFRHYNLDYLIPEDINLSERTDDDDIDSGDYTDTSECGPYEGCDYDNGGLDPAEDEYFNDYVYDDDDLTTELRSIDIEDRETGDKGYLRPVCSLEDLLNVFNADYMVPEEFLSMNIWDLFGVSKKQFDMIDWTHINESNFADFYDAFTDVSRDLVIEKRIRYAIAEASTGYRSIAIHANDVITAEDLLRYAERIIDKHSFEDMRDLISEYIDYLRFYHDGMTMDERRAQNGQPVFGYTLCPKPKNIHDLHDKAFRDYAAMETERCSKNKARLNSDIKSASNNPDYRELLYSDGKYTIEPVTSQEDLVYEGKYLDHCVASYGSFMAEQRSYIYLIREKSAPHTPFYTAEILPARTSKDRPVLNQLYTFHDSTDKSDEFRGFILDWVKKKGIVARCKI